MQLAASQGSKMLMAKWSTTILHLWSILKGNFMPKWIKFICLISIFLAKSPTNNLIPSKLGIKSVFLIPSFVK